MSLALSFCKRLAIFAAISVPVLLTGCANMVTTAPDTALSVSGTMTGKIYGGNQPVSGSTVQAYTVGTTGYGSAGTLLATTTTAADGSFAFSQVTTGATGPSGNSYVCPAPTSQLYVIASGGNTQGTGSSNNSAAVFLAAVGPCSAAASQFVNMNEVTTVASVFALAQYINPGTSTPASASIGRPNTSLATTGINNAFATVANLATNATGTANTSSTITASGTNVATATVTITPESAKINTIANILSACANNATSANSQCTTLFTNAVPPSPAVTSQPGATFNTAVDILQAAYYMATNPVDSGSTALNNLFGLTVGFAPFQPALSSAPTDWTIGVTYSAPVATSTCTSGAPFINYGYQVGVDGLGNVWMANGGNSTNGALSEISGIGKPLACTEVPLLGVRGGAVIDTLGNVWATSNTSSAVYKFDGAGTTTITVPNSGHSYGIAADGSGNVFFADPVATNLKLYELPAAATSLTVPTSIGTVQGASPFAIGIDTKGTVVVGQSGSSGNTISASYPTTVGGTTYTTPVLLAQSSAYAGVYGIAFDASGGFWVGNSAGTSVSAGTGPGNTTSLTPVTYGSSTFGAANTVTFGAPIDITPVFSGGLSTGRQVAIDGAGNVWIPDNTAASSGFFALSEFTKAGVAISPTSTAPGTGTTVTENGGFQKAATVFAGLRGVAIDPSGNVWVTNTASTANNWVTEVVGAAVPVVTPLSAALAANKLGVTP